MLRFVIMFIMFLQLLQADIFIPVDDPRIQLYGRCNTTVQTTALHFLQGLYIYAEFEGTSIGARFDDDFNYLNIFINEELFNIFHQTISGIHDYILAVGSGIYFARLKTDRFSDVTKMVYMK